MIREEAQAARAERWPEIKAATEMLRELYLRLLEMGYRDAATAPIDARQTLLLIEPGCLGEIEGWRDPGGFWTQGPHGAYDLWPVKPIVWRAKEKQDHANDSR